MPSIENVVDDVKELLYPNNEVMFNLFHRPSAEHPNRWILYLSIPNGEHRAKIEFIVDCDENEPQDVDVLGSVLRHGSVSRRTVSKIMDAIIERM
jgi:hypothetical protein